MADRVKQPSAALTGASLAFSSQRTGGNQPAAAGSSHSGGALLAAASASRADSPSRSRSRSRPTLGSLATVSRGAVHGVSEPHGGATRAVRHSSSSAEVRSASFIAATLAASRPASPSSDRQTIVVSRRPSPLSGGPGRLSDRRTKNPIGFRTAPSATVSETAGTTTTPLPASTRNAALGDGRDTGLDQQPPQLTLLQAPPLPPSRGGQTAAAPRRKSLHPHVDTVMAGPLAPVQQARTKPKASPPGLPTPREHHPASHASHEISHERPVKRPPMLQTLRWPASKSDDEDLGGDRARVRDGHKKPLVSGRHKHQEGARLRWREEISSGERRRYEAVWASNRGLFMPPAADSQDNVSNVVVRDLWSRSRLPFNDLAEVWELVDRDGEGSLCKVDFVVGMWLVDQRLRGRKIPTRVGESVWGSARGLTRAAPRPAR